MSYRFSDSCAVRCVCHCGCGVSTQADLSLDFWEERVLLRLYKPHHVTVTIDLDAKEPKHDEVTLEVTESSLRLDKTELQDVPKNLLEALRAMGTLSLQRSTVNVEIRRSGASLVSH